MITRNFDITVRTREQNYIPTVFQVVQNDKNVYSLTIHVVDDAGEIGYSQVDSATITFSKKDGTVVQGNLTIGTNALTYEMGTNEIAYPGEVLASIQLLGPALERLTSARFKFYVVPDLITPGTVQSVSEFTILQQLVADVNQLKQDIVNLQVPNDSLTEAKMANDMKKSITGGVAAHDDLVDLQDDLDSHKAETTTNDVHGLRIFSNRGIISTRTPLYTDNLNDIDVNSIYNINGGTILNGPADFAGWGFVITLVHVHSASYRRQDLYQMGGSKRYTRFCDNNVWHEWVIE